MPEDIKALIEPVFAHRLLLAPDAAMRGVTAAEVLRDGRRVGAGPGARPPRPGAERVRITARGYGLLVRRRRCCSAPASASATRSWPRSAAPASSRSPGALGVRGLATAARPSHARVDPDRVMRGEPSQVRLTIANASRLFGASLVAQDRLRPGVPRCRCRWCGCGPAA